MRRWIAGALAAALLGTTLIGTAAQASPMAMASSAHVKKMKCPFCGMIMTTQKTAARPVPVKIKGVTYYCCSACKGGKAAMHKPKPTM